MTPYRRPDLTPEAEQALLAAEGAQARIRNLDGERKMLVGERDSAVAAARRHGASQRRIAERLQLSPQAVRQMLGDLAEEGERTAVELDSPPTGWDQDSVVEFRGRPWRVAQILPPPAGATRRTWILIAED